MPGLTKTFYHSIFYCQSNNYNSNYKDSDCNDTKINNQITIVFLFFNIIIKKNYSLFFFFQVCFWIFQEKNVTLHRKNNYINTI